MSEEVQNHTRFFSGNTFCVSFFRLAAFAGFLWLAAEFSAFAVLYIPFDDIPPLEEIRIYRPKETTTIHDRRGNVFATLFIENRSVVPFEKISPHLVNAVVAAEDARFFTHDGINVLSILRAAVENNRAGTVKQGGSTITQQLARNMYLSHERTLERKLAETVIAFRLEHLFSKKEILEKYLNEIYFGNGAWGAEVASRTYFGKSASELTLSEAACLAGIIPSPNRFNPVESEELALNGRARVLSRMKEIGLISEKEMEKAGAESIAHAKKLRETSLFEYPYFASHVVHSILVPKFGVEKTWSGGLRVFTTLDPKIQTEGEKIAKESEPQLAIAGMDPSTGNVYALVGGKDWRESKFNRATQAYRQPGSSFKPLVYAGLFEKKGWTGKRTILDAPLSFGSGRNRWSPRNYDGKYRGSVTVETAIVRSLNTPAVRALNAFGVKNGVEFVRSLGVDTPYLPENLTMALGSASVTPLEMLVAFSAFPNGGYRVAPRFVTSVLDRSGKELLDNSSSRDEGTRVLSGSTAGAMRDILTKAVESGTGRRAMVEGVKVFGKTGTTNDFRDAWFIGGLPGFTAVVYVGEDDRKPLGRGATGGVVAAPLWKRFAETAVAVLEVRPDFDKTSDMETPVVKKENRKKPEKVRVEKPAENTREIVSVPVKKAPPAPVKYQEPRVKPPMLTEKSFRNGEGSMIALPETEKRYNELLERYGFQD